MNIIMLGAPATGKGTVASILEERVGITHISTGDIFRKNIKDQTEIGKEAEKYISQGKLVPDEVTIKIVEERLKEDDVQNGVILDGFPRTVAQAEALDKFLTENGKQVDKVVVLNTPEDEIIQRVVNRRVCPQCKAVFNLVLNPPKEEGICDKCGAKLIQREDDNTDTIKQRLSNYYELTSPLVEFYKKQGKVEEQLVSERANRLGKDVAEDLIAEMKNN